MTNALVTGVAKRYVMMFAAICKALGSVLRVQARTEPVLACFRLLLQLHSSGAGMLPKDTPVI